VYSDARLKSDIADYDAGLDVVKQLNPVTFHYNGLEGLATDETQIGLVAQDVEQVAPYMVSRRSGNDLADVRVMSPQALPYLLINAIQELEAKVADLERQLAERE